jgi:acylphosphatase
MTHREIQRLDNRMWRSDNATMLVCKKVRYSGRVQGVGFRQTALSIASDYAVVGYVRNLAQGDVEMVVQGEEQDVQAVLQAVAGRMERNIRQCVEHDEQPGPYNEFGIRF